MNRLLKNRNLSTWIGFLFALSILVITIWVSNNFVQELKKEEQLKMETYAKAIETFNNTLDIENEGTSIDVAVSDFLRNVIQSNKISTVVLDEDGSINASVNIDLTILKNPKKLNRLIQQMKNERPPIEISFLDNKQFLYYKNSDLLTKLRYYPVALVLLISLFVYFSYWYFKTLKNTQQSFLWAGMAKETAHQIGTPLSSLMGWIELLKLENIDQSSVKEMEYDVNRLNQIAERFSKIGSIPELKPQNIVAVSKKTFDYLQSRISDQIEFQFYSEKTEIMIPLNIALFSWVLENLIKNSADAMTNQGNLSLKIMNRNKNVEILISDSGSGIPKHLHKRIFEPGYTTKKRGWGLGLSLAKRIVEEYHNGKISVLKSEKNRGSTFQILLSKK